MKKRILILLTAALLTLGLAACGNDDANKETKAETEAPTVEETEAKEDNKKEEDEKVTYTVTVVDEAGNPVEGATVQVCENKDNGVCFLPGATDNKGVYTLKKESGDYKVKVTMEGYTTEAEYTVFESGKTAMTVTVTKAEVKAEGFTVTVVDTEGNPVVGAMVQFCETKEAGICLMPAAVDANGVYTLDKEGESSDYKVMVFADGYVSKDGDDYIYFKDGEKSMTVVMEPAYVVTVVDEDGNPVVGAVVQFCEASGDMCFAPAIADADGVAVFKKAHGDYKVMVIVEEKGMTDYRYLEANEFTLEIVLTAESLLPLE